MEEEIKCTIPAEDDNGDIKNLTIVPYEHDYGYVQIVSEGIDFTVSLDHLTDALFVCDRVRTRMKDITTNP